MFINKPYFLMQNLATIEDRDIVKYNKMCVYNTHRQHILITDFGLRFCDIICMFFLIICLMVVVYY